MNKKERYFVKYKGDTRYEKVWEQMQLLSIEDVTTDRQGENGTITWRLPIKNEWPRNRKNATYIEVASFKSGYVRNNNSGYSNYQLNKRCESEPEYYEVERNGQTLYRKFTTRTCKLIPIEIDRLEYLISYCLKNYYIKHANFVANGDYVPKWRHEYDLKHISKADHYDKINDLEEDLKNMTEARDCYKDKYKKLDDFYEASANFNKSMDEGMKDRIKDLEDKLDTIQRISKYGKTK